MARLLVIDQEESLCRVLDAAFRKRGHVVETASSGQAAKKKIESQAFDLVISGIRHARPDRDRIVSVCPQNPKPRAVHSYDRRAHSGHSH